MEATSSEQHVSDFMTDSFMKEMTEPGYFPDVSLVAMTSHSEASGTFQGRS